MSVSRATAGFDDLEIASLRRKRGAKWSRYGPDVLPCWVADMDFALAAPIAAELARALEGGDLGYSRRLADGPLPEIFAEWAARRFGWSVDPARVTGLADVVQGIYLTIQIFSRPGDGVATLTPVYPPFLRAVADLERRLVCSTLVRGRERYTIDFDHLAASLTPDVRVLLLCNPHNPSGRVLARAELERLAALAVERDLVVLADEIHADLVYGPAAHVPFASLGPEVARRTITMTSATKSFNIAGLRFAVAVFGSEALERRFATVPERVRGGINCLGVYATEAAWREGESWLEALVAYLRANRELLAGYVREHLPGVGLLAPEGTFLAWLDCRALGLEPSPFDFFLARARVAFSDGRDFGDGGEGFVRLNFATSRHILEAILERTRESLIV